MKWNTEYLLQWNETWLWHSFCFKNWNGFGLIHWPFATCVQSLCILINLWRKITVCSLRYWLCVPNGVSVCAFGTQSDTLCSLDSPIIDYIVYCGKFSDISIIGKSWAHLCLGLSATVKHSDEKQKSWGHYILLDGFLHDVRKTGIVLFSTFWWLIIWYRELTEFIFLAQTKATDCMERSELQHGLGETLGPTGCCFRHFINSSQQKYSQVPFLVPQLVPNSGPTSVPGRTPQYLEGPQ